MSDVAVKGNLYAPEQAASQMRLKLAWTLFYIRFLPLCCGALFASGLIILGGRFLFRSWSHSYSVLLTAGFLAAALVTALYKVSKQLPDKTRLLIFLEGTGGGSGGLLAAGMEIELGAWRSRIGRFALPGLRGRLKYGTLPALAALAFWCGSLWCPVKHYESVTAKPLHIDGEVAEIQEKLEVIEEETLAPEKDLVEIKNTLSELQENNDAGNAGRTYELLEKLTRRIDSIGEEAAGKLRESTDSLSMLSSALNTLAELPEDLRPADLSPELAEVMKKLAAANPDLAELLKQAAANGMDLNKLDPDSMRKLAESMKNMSAELRDKLGKLVEAKLVRMKPCASGKCTNPGKCSGGSCEGDAVSLADWLSENAPEAECLLAGLCALPVPGQGAPTRGRGDAELFLSGNTQEDGGARRTMQVDGMTDPAQSITLATFAGAPDPDEERRAAATGKLQGGNTAIEQRRTVIRPEHRAAVEQYFQVKSKQESDI